jgi:hypothetical protein
MCNIVYNDKVELEEYCENKYDVQLLRDYVSTTKSVLKHILITSLEYLAKRNRAVYIKGHMLVYSLGRRCKGRVNTNVVNDVIQNNELAICNAMNKEHNLSKKLKGRQNLFVIYNKESLLKEFNQKKIEMLMNDATALAAINNEVEVLYDDYLRVYVDEDHPIISYNSGIKLVDIEECKNSNGNLHELGIKISNIIRQKVRKQLNSKHYPNEYTGEDVYIYNEYNDKAMRDIEKVLFKYYDANFGADNSFDPTQFDNSDIDELFDRIWNGVNDNNDNFER